MARGEFDLDNYNATIMGMPKRIVIINPRSFGRNHSESCVHCMIDRSLIKSMNDNLMKSQQESNPNVMSVEDSNRKGPVFQIDEQHRLAKEYKDICRDETRLADELRVIDRIHTRMRTQWAEAGTKRRKIMEQLANVTSGIDINAPDPTSCEASKLRNQHESHRKQYGNEPIVPEDHRPMATGGIIESNNSDDTTTRLE